jgi:hypothetical protein
MKEGNLSILPPSLFLVVLSVKDLAAFATTLSGCNPI